jgi:hypothetical protein
MKITDCKIGKKYQINPSGTIGTLMKTENGLGWDIEQEHFYKKCSDGLVRFGTGIDNNDEDTYEDYLEIEEYENNPKQLKEFLEKLNCLVDEFHPNIYLLDDVFKGIQIIEISVLDELNKR